MYFFKLIVLSLFLLSLLFTGELFAQNKRYTVSGTIKDGTSGEDLIGATVYVKSLKSGTATNTYGFYSLSLPPGKYEVIYAYLGYTDQIFPLELSKDQTIHIKLKPAASQLEEVVVSAERANANVTRTEMSVEKLSGKTIKLIPALMGEVDVIKAIQLLPGVQAASEGTTGFSVRGGSYDQNLILLDEATVYNASHLMGFFSVFNNDAVKDVKLYKGDIPATFGGRLSSLLDIRSRDGNTQRLSGTGGIGLISSRLTLEGPLFSEKATFLLSGRRTYADIFLALANDADLRSSSLYFYDMNLKFNYSINDNNRIYAAGYLGRDFFGMKHAEMGFGNKTFTLRWNHIFSPKLFSNFTLIGSYYDYKLKTNFNEQLSEEWKSKMEDYGFKADFSYHLNPSNNIKFGYNLVYHKFMTGEGGGSGEESILDRIYLPNEYAMEQSLYLSNEMKIKNRLTLKYGLRYTLFQNISNGEEIDFLENYNVAYSEQHKKGKFYHSQYSIEPRIGALYQLDDRSSLKGSYSRTTQFIQLASNSAAGSPLDVWFQASQNVKPQHCDQFALGYFRNFSNNKYEFSIEAYYKKMKDLVDFKDHADLMINEDMEQELRFGKGKSYGLELMLRKNSGRLNGWISYTYSKSERKVDEINNNEWYRSPFDKPVNISIVANYELTPKWTISGNWVFASGTPVTYPVGRFQVENNYVPIYAGRNENRYPSYHRLDLSATVNLSKPGKRLKHDLNISVYNAYGRKNPWMIYFQQEDERPDTSYAEMIYLFSFVPSVTWNFTF
ncbi:TonB-dependent receptor [Porphyromonadaceae bacterium OttesenSCG-928-L07]|nr:TonB-dependent receptor [Porphyromonadaceae bacterium OttesenSCG-928-L07]MDL2251633.1 TonB-dependent receptor [Odoribacter sp. OttesenSCG-928-J03]